jgi:uncharacterized Zn finger protein (UPF0148 family)
MKHPGATILTNRSKFTNKCKHEKKYKTQFGGTYCPTCDREVKDEQEKNVAL